MESCRGLTHALDYDGFSITVKTRIIEPCAMKSRISFSGTGAKTQQKHSPFPPSETEGEQIFLTLLRKESPTT